MAKIPMSWVARALETDETRGLMRAMVDAETDQILGAAILGVEGGEVMTVLQMAMMGSVPYTTIRDGVFCPRDSVRAVEQPVHGHGELK
jgi:pyruvate/2-oxoglutarate dehydrogenase complex dihydrolipoamide dehydrogenase (E3) component